jgi:hypothetical protein
MVLKRFFVRVPPTYKSVENQLTHMQKSLSDQVKKNKAPKKKKACSQCQEGPEYYRMLFDQYKFDVDKAREITSDGREALLLERDDVEYAVKWSHIHEPHLDHVDLQYPGIIAHYWYATEEGSILHGTVLIDGHHRAAKALRDNVPFYVRILNERESQEITLRQPLAVTPTRE